MSFFFQTAAESLRCCWKTSNIQDELPTRHGNGKVLESGTFKLHKSIVALKLLK